MLLRNDILRINLSALNNLTSTKIDIKTSPCSLLLTHEHFRYRQEIDPQGNKKVNELAKNATLFKSNNNASIPFINFPEIYMNMVLTLILHNTTKTKGPKNVNAFCMDKVSNKPWFWRKRFAKISYSRHKQIWSRSL